MNIMNIDQLNNDIIINIFSNLLIKETNTLWNVCKRWNSIKYESYIEIVQKTTLKINTILENY